MYSHSNPNANPNSKTRPALIPYFIGSTIAAVAENLLFHWADTLSKRIQNNRDRLSIMSPDKNEFKKALLPNVTSVRGVIPSLYQGLTTGIIFRIIQRNVMFAAQPYADFVLNKHAGPMVEDYFGYRYRGPIVAGIAGLMSSTLEMPFLCFDTAKVRMQTQGITFMDAMKQGNLYYAWKITMLRNVIAATALFGGAAFVRQQYGLDSPMQATLVQEGIASSCGALLATSLNNWADMLKTRLQGSNGEKTAIEIAKPIWAEEGLRGLFLRGLIPRLMTVAPRAAFSMTVVNQIVKKVNSVSEQGLFSVKNSQTSIKPELTPESNAKRPGNKE